MSLLLLTGGSRRIVASADARVTRGGKPIQRECRKIHQCGKWIIIGDVGVAASPSGEWTPDLVASKCQDPKLQHSALALLEAIRDAMQPRLEAAAKADRSLPEHFSFFSAVAAEMFPGRPLKIVELYFPIIEDGGMRKLGAPVINAIPSGDVLIALGCPIPDELTGDGGLQFLDTRLDDTTLQKNIDSTFARTRELSRSSWNAVGPVTHVAELSSRGVRWLRHQPIEKRPLPPFFGWKEKLRRFVRRDPFPDSTE